ncbi:HAMP domain-containing sensor histidine kinase [Calothrix sp. UHCC 0171]|uniref:sensor histidine kinase n=1 Tax=Calothrix sp. UHCC 0171 TaxID=3110245 RepID=UPI002B1EE90A|nr:HAMP domain-containing sensor histidine kinase [Calothrix sp. UHCC 0171]MEA5573047.1 HAMP domain-containing sensor histidine kinase [Calothrix sp. UHCC 0171]
MSKLAQQPVKFFRNWFKVFGEARTRILLWYLLLMTFFIAIAIPTIHNRLFAKVQARVEKDIDEEITEFQKIVTEGYKNQEAEDLERLRKRKDKIIWEPPQNLAELIEIFNIYFSDELPDDDVYFIAVVKGEFYTSTPRALPNAIDRNSALMKRWLKLTEASRDEVKVDDPRVGSILYAAYPIRINNEVMGVFIAAHTTAGEREEALEALQVISEVQYFALIVALLLAWFAAGRVLAPLRTFIQTAQSISESNLAKRIPVDGGGEIAELAKTFNAMMDRLEAAFATQRNFINDAGHELRTPIAIIRGHLELMGDEPEEQQETLAIAMDELDRMTRFVDDLVLLAKAERPDFLILDQVDIAAFTEEVFNKAKALAPRNWQLDAVAKGKMLVDRQRLTQAIMNLAHNATQYTEEDSIIYIGSGISKGKVRFWVQDTGAGITPADQKRIFERFARAANSHRRSEGAGLGLSIVKAITQAHSGKIYLKSALGTGSTFTLVLPLEPLKQEVVSDESNSHRRR